MEGEEKQQIVYQTAVLNPQLVEAMVYDDSPPTLNQEFWQFLGIDIPLSDIKPWDFKNILDMVDLTFAYKLFQYPEDVWDNLLIVEYKKDPETGELRPQRAWHLTTVWHDIRTKVYLKMCRAREGFTLNALTEQRSKITELSNIPSIPFQGVPLPISDNDKKKWRVV